MDNTAFFDQLKRNIQNLLVENRLNEAYLKCNEILQKYPNNKDFRNLKDAISAKLYEENKDKVKQGFKEVKKLIKSKEEEKALRRMKELLEMAPNNIKLKKLYLKTQEQYKQKFSKLESEFLGKEKKTLSKLIEKGTEDELLTEIDKLEMNYGKNKKIRALAEKTKEEYIQKQIFNKHDLLKSTKFEEIKEFLDHLKNIKKESPTICKIEAIISKRKIGSQMENIEDYIYSGNYNINTLMKLKKYDEAAQAATEILQAHPGNKEAKKILKKANKQSFFKHRKAAVKTVASKFPALKTDLKAHPENYVRI
ncbi:hypothetical protein HOE67_02380 [Candidatus Peregrinibacteria bacterium]|nr:hypothetical protein [Candidatus Peregrinibacteria bacterium]MBT4055936.1 hypothetical protein [Candidatus Peregrinibacteria bacterium]